MIGFNTYGSCQSRRCPVETFRSGAEAILVTEDEKLLKAASKFVKTITYTDLESKLAQNNH
ncbi:hypothetical protein KEJ26_01365 [Candidatus Bathyarchaeota archaeon]|nr:hypothetical protein [Candidatus Bathyarchaeota archaeon]